MKHHNVHEIFTINTINLIISIGLFALSIIMIVYGLSLPSNKCNTEQYFAGTNSDCLFVTSNHISNSTPSTRSKTQKMTDDAQALKLLAVITGFILVIPLILNIIEFVLIKNNFNNKTIENINEITSTLSPQNLINY